METICVGAILAIVDYGCLVLEELVGVLITVYGSSQEISLWKGIYQVNVTILIPIGHVWFWPWVILSLGSFGWSISALGRFGLIW